MDILQYRKVVTLAEYVDLAVFFSKDFDIDVTSIPNGPFALGS